MTPLRNNIRRVSSTDGGIVLDLARGTMFSLNPLGSQVLDLLERGDSLHYIAEQISVQSGVSLDLVQADIQEFLKALQVHGVLDPRGSKT
jgi:hypothetical protein